MVICTRCNHPFDTVRGLKSHMVQLSDDSHSDVTSFEEADNAISEELKPQEGGGVGQDYPVGGTTDEARENDDHGEPENPAFTSPGFREDANRPNCPECDGPTERVGPNLRFTGVRNGDSVQGETSESTYGCDDCQVLIEKDGSQIVTNVH